MNFLRKAAVASSHDSEKFTRAVLSSAPAYYDDQFALARAEPNARCHIVVRAFQRLLYLAPVIKDRS
jgi:hypothetical protein